MKKIPPKIALKFLRWFCKEDRIEEIEGDLVELFEKRIESSPRKAKFRFTWDVFKSFRWINIRKPASLTERSILFRNYLKVGFRNIRKDPHYTTLNVLGLSMGLAVFVIMIMMVRHEMTFDKFHAKSDRIYEVIQEFQNIGGADPEIYTALPLSAALREEVSIVENAVTVHGAASTWFEVNGNRYFEEDGIVAGPQFFEIFDFKLKYGNKESALKSDYSILIDQNLAEKLFGWSNPIGEVIEIERYGSFTVTGVLESVPANSFMQFNFIITQNYDVFFTHVAPWFPRFFESWEGDPATTFVLVHDPSDALRFQADVQPVLEKYIDDSEAINPHYLLNLEELHFGSNGIDGRVNEFVKGDMAQLRLMVIVAVLILLMAVVNYINITTTRSVKRRKEVGIRKSIGARSSQITRQFLTESFLQVFLAFILSVLWIYFLMPYFNSITGIQLEVNSEIVLQLVPYTFLSLILISIFSGAYPALYLSRFAPEKVLKNSAGTTSGNNLLRNGLVIVQYCLVIAILSSLFIVNQQYRYLSKKDLGMDTEQLLVVEVNGGGVRSNYINLKNELLSNTQISHVTGLTRMIGGYRGSVGIRATDPDDPASLHPMRFYGMDQDGLRALGLELLLGTDFTGEPTVDSTSIFLNESAATLFGGRDIVGKTIILADEEDENSQIEVKVSGIIKNFHYRSLHESIGPVVVGYYKNPFESLDDIVIRIAGNDITQTLAYVEDVHNKFDENDVMTWEFMDDMVQRAYEKEMIFRKIFLGASVISLVMALLGIIGLISYNVLARTKELGIRKVLGASYFQLLSLLGKAFLIFLLLAAFIITPFSWLLASEWLKGYAYRIDLTSTPFLTAFLVILASTVLTIWFINHRSVKKNAVEALRYE